MVVAAVTTTVVARWSLVGWGDSDSSYVGLFWVLCWGGGPLWYHGPGGWEVLIND